MFTSVLQSIGIYPELMSASICLHISRISLVASYSYSSIVMEEREKNATKEKRAFNRFHFIINTIFVSKIFAVLVLLQKYNMVTWLIEVIE